MLLNLSDVLTCEGKQESFEIPLEMESFDCSSGSFRVLEKTPIYFSFTNIGKEKARVEGECKITFCGVCDRCLTEVPTTLSLQFERIVACPDVVAEDEVVDDLGFMEGYQLNTETFMYHEIIGSWPAKILCKEDCKGICPVCGQNRNERECGCDTFVPDPRMAVIQDIFKGDKEV